MSTGQRDSPVVEVIRSSIQTRAEGIAYAIREQDDIDVRLDELLIRNTDEYLLVKEFRAMQLQKKKTAARGALAELPPPPIGPDPPKGK